MNLKSALKPRRRILRIASLAAVALVLVYALTGFLLAPWLAKRELPRFVDEQFQRRARVGEIAFNPFTLVLRVNDFALEEKDGRPIFGFHEATVDLGWRSLVRRGWVLSAARLTEPAVRVEISKENRLNLAALATGSGGGPTRPEPVRFAIGHIAIENGRIDFEDQREGYKNSFERLSFELSSLSTLDHGQGPYALTAQTGDGATLRWEGALSLQPLAVSGTLALKHASLPPLNPYLNDYLKARIVSGHADIELPYRFTLDAGKPQVNVTGAKLALQDFSLAALGTEPPFAKLGRLALEGVTLDLQARRAAAQSLRAADFAIAASRDRQGVLDLSRLLVERETDPASPAWQAGISAVELADGHVSFTDLGSGLALTLERAAAKLTDASSDTSKPLAFELAADIGKGGRISARGKAMPAAGALEARVEASGIALAPLQPLLAQYANVKLASGELSLAGDLRAGDKSPKFVYAGSAAITNAALQDDAGTRLIAWKSLATSALRVSLAPDRAEIDELRWNAPAGRLAIAADRTTNIGRVFRHKEETAIPGAAKGGGQSADKPGESGSFAVKVRRVRVEQGALDFSDDSLSPGFATGIHELTGTVNGVSSERDTYSQFTLEGRVNEYGYARLSGALNPFAPRDRTSFRVQFRNLDVAKVSPYTMKFAGYRVASGRLSLDLNYRVRNNLLEGDNQIVLDQFTLGERVESPSALNLPLELAVALLKDADGRIDVAVPISGNLDDPQFSYGALIWKAIGNLVTSVVTAPFRALARVFGGSGEELGTISFEPGSSRLLPPEREKIGRIVQALAKRPELKLVIPGRYDAEADALALKRAALRREIGKRAGFNVTEEDPPGPISLEDRPTRDALRALFAERFSETELDRLKAEAEAKAREAGAESGKAQQLSVLDRLRNFARGEPQVADAREFYRTLARRLIDAQPIAGDALSGLAQKRAATIAAALQAAGADPARVAQSDAGPTSKTGAKEVALQLSLTAAR